MKNHNNWPLEHWHIEISGKCPLKCPRCTRQELPGYVNKELSLEWFKENFTFAKHVKKITFCGDDGDPIYAKDLLSIIEWLKKQNPKVQFVIVTNGSFKTRDWWTKLNSLLDENDNVHFSLDGWDQTSNKIYRINCNWDSIVDGIKQLTNPYKTWAAIAFKFNEQKIEYMKQMALALRFDRFQLTLSTKFGKNYGGYPSDDPLQPSDEYVAQGRFTRQFTALTTRKWIDSTIDIFTKRFHEVDISKQSVIPLCMIGNKGLYINAEGKFFPCCWTGLRYSHNKNLFDYIDFDRKLPDILEDQKWKKLQSDLLIGEGPKECFEKCSSAKWNFNHATEW
jgi:MoaA/NifB/PqqE/SkfB family radical SAM enzyme